MPRSSSESNLEHITLICVSLISWVSDLDGALSGVLFQSKSRPRHIFNPLLIQSRLGDVLDLLMAWSLMRKCGKIEGGLPTQIHMRMVFNLAVDFLVGLVPFVGDLADAAFRCNTKNAALLEEYLMKKYGPKSMSMKEKRQSRLEDLDSDQLQALKDPEKSHSPAGPRRPEPTAQRDRKTGGRWLGGERKREPDVEMGGQHTGRTREV